VVAQLRTSIRLTVHDNTRLGRERSSQDTKAAIRNRKIQIVVIFILYVMSTSTVCYYSMTMTMRYVYVNVHYVMRIKFYFFECVV